MEVETVPVGVSMQSTGIVLPLPLAPALLAPA
jgi:hypothetical protein